MVHKFIKHGNLDAANSVMDNYRVPEPLRRTAYAYPLWDPQGFRDHPPTYWQACTNDIFYDDCLSYARALSDAGVAVYGDVYQKLPHTFWLKSPRFSMEPQNDFLVQTKKLLGGEFKDSEAHA
jgi:acetyl esterase/lipase